MHKLKSYSYKNIKNTNLVITKIMIKHLILWYFKYFKQNQFFYLVYKQNFLIDQLILINIFKVYWWNLKIWGRSKFESQRFSRRIFKIIKYKKCRGSLFNCLIIISEGIIIISIFEFLKIK